MNIHLLKKEIKDMTIYHQKKASAVYCCGGSSYVMRIY
jgi:hypothetical protein